MENSFPWEIANTQHFKLELKEGKCKKRRKKANKNLCRLLPWWKQKNRKITEWPSVQIMQKSRMKRLFLEAKLPNPIEACNNKLFINSNPKVLFMCGICPYYLKTLKSYRSLQKMCSWTLIVSTISREKLSENRLTNT